MNVSINATLKATVTLVKNSARDQAVELFIAMVAMDLPTFVVEDSFHNGTGYFDGLLSADVPGTDANKTYVGVAKDGRRILLLPKIFGKNMVVFERYTPGGTSPMLLVVQTTNKNSRNDPMETLAAMVELAESV